MKDQSSFQLNVHKNHQDCRFELSWGQGQQVTVYVPYPQTLTQVYQGWQRAYLRYYQNHKVRGRIAKQGNFQPLNPHTQLVQAETKLLKEFLAWLNHERLSNIRQVIAQEIKQRKENYHKIYLFLTCSTLELERLPWEAWELDKEMASNVTIQLVRTPTNIRSVSAQKSHQSRHRKARILAILGDETGLDFQNDLKAIYSLSSVAEIHLITWQENKSISHHKAEICQGLSDQKGWDILLFAGHSQETELTGGALGIAPRTSITLQELEPYFKIAQAKGLQLALFNSCSGLNIANTLIDWGINQVIIMREPIQNEVAQIFLLKFLKNIMQEKNLSDALRETCQFLKEKKNLDYPSAYLIPSLFSRTDIPFYQLKKGGLKTYLKQALPNRQQAIALTVVLLLSLYSPLQQFLLDKRILVQAIYRDLTQQIPQNSPPVLLISIDDESLNKAKITERNPLNRRYLARIIDQLSTFNPKVIGIDYLLDRPQGQNDQILSQSIHRTIQERESLFIFASIPKENKEIGVNNDIVSLNQVMQGSIASSPLYMATPDKCDQICPFSYLIAVNQVLSHTENLPDPLTSQRDYKTQILSSFEQTSTSEPIFQFLQQVKVHPLTHTSEYFRQRWLQPIIDFSLPPNTIYKTLPAWQLLNEDQQSLSFNELQTMFNNKVVLIASGGYAEAGIDGEKDYFDPPLAIIFWNSSTSKLTGGEAHAYTIHHWLTQHLIIPLPTPWLILLTALLGKIMVNTLDSSSLSSKYLMLKLLGVNALSVLLSLQIFIDLNLLIPLLLPSLVFWSYVLPAPRASSRDSIVNRYF